LIFIDGNPNKITKVYFKNAKEVVVTSNIYLSRHGKTHSLEIRFVERNQKKIFLQNNYFDEV
jgi:hypothetical protein